MYSKTDVTLHFQSKSLIATWFFVYPPIGMCFKWKCFSETLNLPYLPRYINQADETRPNITLDLCVSWDDKKLLTHLVISPVPFWNPVYKACLNTLNIKFLNITSPQQIHSTNSNQAFSGLALAQVIRK